MTVAGKAYAIVKSPIFSRFILLTILVNCVFLANEDPSGEHALSGDGAAQILFSAIFFVEMVLKLTAYSPAAYFEDAWNCLDFAVVMESIFVGGLAIYSDISHHPTSISNISSIRALRVLRVIRTIGFIPKIKLLLDTFFGSWDDVLEITVFISMLILVFANFMECNYQLTLDRRCATQVQDFRTSPSTSSLVVFKDQLCGRYHCTTNPCANYLKTAHSDALWEKQFPLPFRFVNRTYPNASSPLHSHLARQPVTNLTLFQCSMSDMVCLNAGASPNGGLFSFDDIFSAMFAMFQILTFDGWQDGLFYLQDGVSSQVWLIYFIFILVAVFILVNLYPAVISVKLERVLEKYEEDRKERSNLHVDASKEDTQAALQKRSEFQKVLYYFNQVEEKDQELIKKIESAKRGHLKTEEVMEDNLPFLTPTFEGSAQWREFVKAETGPFSLFIYGCIIVNILMLAPQVPETGTAGFVLRVFNLFFEALFFLEALIKLFLFGPVGYFSQSSNAFDFAVSCLGFVDVCTPPSINLSRFSGLRILRLLRLTQLAKAIKLERALTSVGRHKGNEAMDIARLFEVLSRSGPWLVYTYLLLGIFLFIFSILGMQFFGGTAELQGYETILLDGSTEMTVPTRQSFYGFSNFPCALVSIFSVFTGDSWGDLAFDAVSGTSPKLLFFFVVWIIISKFFINSLIISSIFNAVKDDVKEVLALETVSDLRALHCLVFSFNRLLERKVFVAWRENAKSTISSNMLNPKKKVGLVLEEYTLMAAPTVWEQFKASDQSWLLFSPDHWFRLLMKRVEQNPLLEILTFSAIVSSSVVVAVQADVQSAINNPTIVNVTSFTPAQIRLYYNVDVFSTIVFTTDFIVRSVSNGCYFLPRAFLKRGFLNKMDLVVTLASLLNLFYPSMPFSAVRLIRLLRCFRPLQILNRTRTVRKIFKAVQTAWQPLFIVLCFQFIILFLFALLGGQFWAGSFKYCEYPGKYDDGSLKPFPVPGTPLTSDNCEVIGNNFLNFDSILNGICSSFIIFTQDGWSQVMHAASATTGYGTEPSTIGYKPWAVFFFIALILISNVLMILLIASIYGTFMYTQLQGDLGRTSTQRDLAWELYRQKLEQIQPLIDPTPPTQETKLKIYQVLSHKSYQTFMTFVLMLNMTITYLYGQSRKHYTQPAPWVNWIDECFEIFYVGEWLVRLYIFDIKEMLDPRVLKCWIDLSVMLVMVINVTNLPVPSINALYPPSLAQFYNGFLGVAAYRIFRLCILHNTLMELAYTVSRSAVHVLGIFTLLWIFTFFFAVVGVLLFGGIIDWTFIDSNQEACNYGIQISECNDFYSRHLNFNDVITGMYTLFGAVSGDHYTDLFLGIWKQQRSSTGKLTVTLFFVIYYILGRFIIVSLFMMTVLFEYHIHSPDQIGLANDEIEKFRECWRAQNGTGHSKMPKDVRKMVEFLRTMLHEPLGVAASTSAM